MVTLNISTTWPSQNAHTAGPRTNVLTPTSATKCATTCNTNASPRSGSPATALRRRHVTRRNANKFDAMGKQTSSPIWPRAYPCRITPPGAPKILQCVAGPPPLRRGNGSSSGGLLSFSTVRTRYLGCLPRPALPATRGIQLFSVMSQLWASEHAAHRVESPLPKRRCRTRPGILGQRPPPDMAPTKRRKLVTLEDLWGMAHT